MIKKKIWFSALATLSLFLGACGGQQSGGPAESSANSSSSASSEEVTTGATEQSYTAYEELQEEYDVIIVGAGGAGLAAAIQAKDAGMSPVILEKMPIAGGNTLKASAGMNASETKFQEAQGVEDSSDLFFEETLKGGKGANDQKLLRYLTDHSADAIDWLDSMGITLDNLTTTGGMSVTRTHRPTDGSAVGEYLVDGLLRNISERDIPLFVNADVKEVMKEDGQVTGVHVLFNQEEEKTISSKAVIVTTGGFGANMEMITEYKPELEGYVSTNQKGSTGDGIKMIQAVGGAVVDLEQIQIHPTVQQESGYLITEAVRGEGAILISQAGERFFNEMQTRDEVSAAINLLPEKYAYLILDSGVKERVKAINFYEEQGFVESAETIEELAAVIHVPTETLTATWEQWNQNVANGADEQFGRTTAMQNDLSAGPFYAIQIAPGIHHTMGGVKVNSNTEVLTEDGSIIPGLYAAGELTGGLHGENRIGGNAVADIIIFGRQAGTKAAEFVAQ